MKTLNFFFFIDLFPESLENLTAQLSNTLHKLFRSFNISPLLLFLVAHPTFLIRLQIIILRLFFPYILFLLKILQIPSSLYCLFLSFHLLFHQLLFLLLLQKHFLFLSRKVSSPLLICVTTIISLIRRLTVYCTTCLFSTTAI